MAARWEDRPPVAVTGGIPVTLLLAVLLIVGMAFIAGSLL
jgi:hypothetical protein